MKYWIIVLFSFIISFCNGYAAILNPIIGGVNNDSVHRMKLLKLEYAFYIATSDSEKYEALMQKVKLCIVKKEHTKTLYEIKRVELLNPVVLQNQLFYPSVQILLFNATLYNSCLELIERDTLTKFIAEKSFLKTLCLNEEGNYELIVEEIRKAATELKKDTSFIIKKLQNYKVPNTKKKSKIFQALLPGSGMTNEGQLKEGFTSFLLNGVFIVTPIFLIQKQLYFSAFSYGLMPLSKFYLGGIRHVNYLSEENEEKILKLIKHNNAELLFNFYKQQE